MRWQVALSSALLLVACTDETGGADETAPQPSASASADQALAVPDGVVLPPPRQFDNNPLNLPPQNLALEKGQRVYAVPQRMLEGLRLGSSLLFRAARVLEREGDNVLVQVDSDAPYAAHSAYVIAPRPGRMGRGTLLLAPYQGRMRHAVAKSLSGDKVVVRFSDLGRVPYDVKVSPSELGVLPEGTLAPGGFAVHRTEHEHRHVTLVSTGPHADGTRRWLVIGHRGQAELVEAGELEPLPPRRFRPRVGSDVLVAWRGRMVAAKIRDIDDPGIYSVKRPRAGAPLIVGPGMLMPAPLTP